MTRLDNNRVEAELKSREDWVFHPDHQIKKVFVFDDFENAFSFMLACAVYAEKINHHPEWKNTYNKVEVILTTHDVSGVSELDFKMASFMDKVSKT